MRSGPRRMDRGTSRVDSSGLVLLGSNNYRQYPSHYSTTDNGMTTVLSRHLPLPQQAEETRALNFAPASAPVQFEAIRINCGGESTKDVRGKTWLEDQFYNKGFVSKNRLGVLKSSKGESTLFKTYRYAFGSLLKPLKYNIPVPDGAYEVTLYFPETIMVLAPKLRRFSVRMEQSLAFTSDDIPKPTEVGGDNGAASVMSYTTVVQDGSLEIRFDARLGRKVYVAAILIQAAAATSMPTPPLICTSPEPTQTPAALVKPTPASQAPILVAQPTANDTAVASSFRINAGSGSNYTDSLGKVWNADAYFTGGLTYADTTYNISDTEDDSLYQTERNGDFSYDFVVPVGNYEIILHFAELVYTSVAQRVFDVTIEGMPVFVDVDLVKLGSGGTKKALELETVQLVSDGTLSIVFQTKMDRPKLCAMEVKLNAPHYAHAVANGPYEAVDSEGIGSAVVSVDGGPSHTHAPGRKLVEFYWRTASTPLDLGKGETANLTLPVGVHTVTLTVIDDGGNESSDSTTITVRPGGFPVIIDILPNTGSIAGGNDVTIAGSGYTASAANTVVNFGLVALTGSSIQIINSKTIKVKAPTLSLGLPVFISVKTPVGESATKTYTYVANSQIEFLEKKLQDFSFPTRVAFGPDGKLYVASVNGKLAKLTLDANYNVVNSVISEVSKNRVILGLAFDPLDTSVNPLVYFTNWAIFHGEFKSTSGKAINGKISIASGANLDVVRDLITGLPVSDGDHGVNGLEFGNNGELYIQIGGNTNGGIPGRLSSTQKQKDSFLSAATLVAHVSKPNFNGALTYTAEDDGDLNAGYDVKIFATGSRNPVGIVLHSNGKLYGTDNGPDLKYGDMLTSCSGASVADIEQDDEINLLVQDAYYGHPNLKRARTDARQCAWQGPAIPSGNGYTAPIVVVPSSTNGIIEFHSNHFDGQLRGNLITSRYKGGLYRIILTADGTGVVPESKEPFELIGDGLLDVTQHPDGTMFDSRYDTGEIYYYKPIERNTKNTVTILSVFPRRGGNAGGSKLVIYGRNLNKNCSPPTVQVGGSDCNITAVSAAKLECSLPGGSGTVDVTVTVRSEASTLTGAYRYISGIPL